MGAKAEATEALGDDSDPTYTHFAHRDEFLTLLKQVLTYDLAEDTTADATPAAVKRALAQEKEENELVALMGAILDHYLPLPPLLDPALDSIIPPLMDKIGAHLHNVVSLQTSDVSTSSGSYTNEPRLARLGRLVNWVVKVRGWKAVVPHFSPDIRHLPMLTALLSSPSTPTGTESTAHNPIISSPDAWELRAVLLIWLSLVLTVPFSLSAFAIDTPVAHSPSVDLATRRQLFPRDLAISAMAQQVTLLAIPLLSRPGKESSLAALVLARLFSRPDSTVGLEPFFAYAQTELDSETDEPTLVIALLNILALLPGLLAKERLVVVRRFLENQMLPYLKGSRMAMGSGLIRKLAVKAGGRWWVTSLGKGASKKTGRAVVHGSGILQKFSNEMHDVEDDADFDPPDGLEDELDALMGALSDKDTIVRYSAAKYLSRLSVLLPASFSNQIVSATISLFAGTESEPVIETDQGKVIEPGGSAFGADDGFGLGGKEIMRGESRWHGVCLAVAEMARRGLVREELVAEAVTWVLKALTFDIRRANHSIGANVRDAAAYVVWSLSRACSPEALAPFAEQLATKLVCVAVLDREVGVRRAASAAFQEGVGRLGHFPHGISVLGLTDFYSVSVRRTAFLVAAPRVAQFEIYRTAMIKHLHHITLRHWDPAVRSIGSRSLRMIAQVAGLSTAESAATSEIAEVSSLDTSNVHGALLALGELTDLFEAEAEQKLRMLQALDTIRAAALTSFQTDLLLSAACNLLAKAITSQAFQEAHVAATEKTINRFLELGMKSRSEEVQEAAARVIGFITGLTKSSRAAQKQSYALALGAVQYAQCPRVRESAIRALLSALDGGNAVVADVETRRNAIRSLTAIAASTNPSVHEDTFRTIYEAILQSLSDYTTDQRGDVGSWIRSTALTSLPPLIRAAIAADDVELNQKMVDASVAGVIKQGVEKLDNLRETAGRALTEVVLAVKDHFELQEINTITALLPSDDLRWQEPDAIYPAVMPLLAAGTYRSTILSGLVLSIGSKLESTSCLSGSALADFLKSQLPRNPSVATSVMSDLVALLVANLNQNRIFVPTLTALFVLSESGVLQDMRSEPSLVPRLNRAVNLTTKAIPNMKNMERIMASMKLITSLVALDVIRTAANDHLTMFLTHRYPTVRSATAERLYLTLEAMDVEAEEIEELLLSTPWADSIASDEAGELVSLLRRL